MDNISLGGAMVLLKMRALRQKERGGGGGGTRLVYSLPIPAFRDERETQFLLKGRVRVGASNQTRKVEGCLQATGKSK